jgi:hypothetical protein
VVVVVVVDVAVVVVVVVVTDVVVVALNINGKDEGGGVGQCGVCGGSVPTVNREQHPHSTADGRQAGDQVRTSHAFTHPHPFAHTPSSLPPSQPDAYSVQTNAAT